MSIILSILLMLILLVLFNFYIEYYQVKNESLYETQVRMQKMDSLQRKIAEDSLKTDLLQPPIWVTDVYKRIKFWSLYYLSLAETKI